MRFMLWFSLLFISILLVGYLLLFTKPGNLLLTPLLQSKLNKNLPFAIKVEEFRLDLKDIFLNIKLSQNNSLILHTKYNIFSKSVAGEYELKVMALEELNDLTKMQLQGSFYTKGEIKGTLKHLELTGLLAIADGGGKYSVSIKEQKLDSVVFDFAQMQSAKLLTMKKLPPYLQGKLYLKGSLKDFETLKGSVQSYVEDGVLDKKLFAKRYDIELPQTSFDANMSINFDKHTNYNINLSSKIANLFSKGSIKEQKIKAFYEFDIKYLQALEEIIGKKLQGSFAASGMVEGQKDAFDLLVVSSFAQGLSRYTLQFKDMQPQMLQGKSQNLQLSSLLFMLDQPRVADADIDIETTIDLSKDSKKKEVKLFATHGKFNNEYFKKKFDKSFLKHNNFSFKILSDLDTKEVTSRLFFDADIAKLKMKKAVYDKREQTFFSDYNLTINDLSKLEGVSPKKMRGRVDIQGDIIYDINLSDPLIVNGTTKSFDGEMVFELAKQQLQADAKAITVEKLLYSLYLPQFLKGPVQSDLEYDLEKKDGVLQADMQKAKFAKNFFTEAVYNYSGVDLTTYDLEKAKLHSRIKGELIANSFDIKADTVVLKSDRLLIDTKHNTIKGEIKLQLKEKLYTIKVNGSLDNLQKAFDYEDLLRQEVQRQIEKKAKEFIQKELGKNLFKGLFN